MVGVEGNTVGECLDDLIRQFPDIKEWLFDKNNILKSIIVLDGHPINPKDMGQKVRDGSELHILLIIAGG
jgi:molybdopterin converting factor small subunit